MFLKSALLIILKFFNHRNYRKNINQNYYSSELINHSLMNFKGKVAQNYQIQFKLSSNCKYSIKLSKNF